LTLVQFLDFISHNCLLTQSLFPENISAFVMLYFIIDVGNIVIFFNFLLCRPTLMCQVDRKTEECKMCIERNGEEAEN